MQVFIRREYINYFVFRAPDSSTAITRDSLPSLEILADCCLDADHSCNSGPFVGLHKAFTEFSQMYCKCIMSLPLVCLYDNPIVECRKDTDIREAISSRKDPPHEETILSFSDGISSKKGPRRLRVSLWVILDDNPDSKPHREGNHET